MATEQIRKRNRNTQRLLMELHERGPIQRMELAEACGIRRNSVSSIVADLIRGGWVCEDEPGNVRSRIGLDTRRKWVLGVRVFGDGSRCLVLI